MGGTRGSGIVSSAADMLWMRGVGEVCSGRREWRWGEWMRGLDLGFAIPVRTGGVLDVCGLRWGVGKGAWTKVWWVVLCLCEMWVWILCVDGRSRYLFIVLGGYLRF